MHCLPGVGFFGVAICGCGANFGPQIILEYRLWTRGMKSIDFGMQIHWYTIISRSHSVFGLFTRTEALVGQVSLCWSSGCLCSDGFFLPIVLREVIAGRYRSSTLQHGSKSRQDIGPSKPSKPSKQRQCDVLTLHSLHFLHRTDPYDRPGPWGPLALLYQLFPFLEPRSSLPPHCTQWHLGCLGCLGP